MKLKRPVIITSRLLPGVKIGGAFISIKFAGERNGRAVCHYDIDLPDGHEYGANDLQSGVGGGDLQAMLASLLGFLSAAGESYRYQMRQPNFPEGLNDPDNNSSMFPDWLSEWAYINSDELALLGLELSEETCITE